MVLWQHKREIRPQRGQGQLPWGIGFWSCMRSAEVAGKGRGWECLSGTGNGCAKTLGQEWAGTREGVTKERAHFPGSVQCNFQVSLPCRLEGDSFHIYYNLFSHLDSYLVWKCIVLLCIHLIFIFHWKMKSDSLALSKSALAIVMSAQGSMLNMIL